MAHPQQPPRSYLDQVDRASAKGRPFSFSAAGLALAFPLALALVFGALALAYLGLSAQRPDPVSHSQTITEALARAAAKKDRVKRSNSILLPRDQQNHFYRENDQAGTLFIITGMAENDFSEPLGPIRLKASLLSLAGEALAASRVYAGNLISQDELKSLPLDEIMARLRARPEPGRAIAPGQAVPFMIVFNHQPDGVIEYQVEALDPEPMEPPRSPSDEK